MSLRDDIRTAMLGKSAVFKNKVVKIDGVEVEMRQPTVKSRSELFKKCTDKDGNISHSDFLVWSVIYNTFIPGTNEAVFEEADYDSLVSRPVGGIVDQLGATAGELMNVEQDTEKKSETSAITTKSGT